MKDKIKWYIAEAVGFLSGAIITYLVGYRGIVVILVGLLIAIFLDWTKYIVLLRAMECYNCKGIGYIGLKRHQRIIRNLTKRYNDKKCPRFLDRIHKPIREIKYFLNFIFSKILKFY